MRFFLAFAAATVTNACAAEPIEEAAETASDGASVSIEKLWVADGFTDPEGVALTPDGNYFISNVAGDSADADGEGWISILSTEGEILNEKWADGLDAPKGMTAHDGTLYVADIDRIRRYDVATGENLGDIVVDGAVFLNDVTVWRDNIMVSDSRTARIYSVDGDAVEVWLESEEMIAGVNGLLGDGDRLLISTMSTGSLFAADETGMLTTIATGMIDADGIGLVEGGGYMVSAWRGDIFHVSADGVVAKLQDTRAEEILQNDLTVYGDTIIVPNWNPGTVTAWRIKQ
ncbi:MAG: hypothetical protein AAGJ73_00840 [Pseudomonadota bacterium]